MNIITLKSMKNRTENNDFIELIVKDNSLDIIFKKPITIEFANHYDKLLFKKIKYDDIYSVTFDFSKIEIFDSYFILLYKSLYEYFEKKGIKVTIKGISTDMQRFLALLNKPVEEATEKEKHTFIYNYISDIGFAAINAVKDFISFMEFSGDFFLKFIVLFIHPKRLRWKDLPFHLTRVGVGAVPITVLIVFLIGLITGYQGALQLAQFGADRYIADLIGISITRELAPLMTAIIVAGRSGAAFAAEIGTMKVSDEIDALSSMGFDVMHFLVLPRVLAVMIAMPILTLITDIAGIGGGLLSALGTLDITLTGYLNELQFALNYSHVFSGVLKSIIFGFLVAAVGCFRGLQVRGGAESVGKYTTSAVVSGVFLIILADAIFTFLLQSLGI